MRLKLKREERKIHDDICSWVCWNSENELYSISDDMTCHTWDLLGNNVGKAMDIETPVIDFDWIISMKKSGELMAMGCADGTILFASHSRKVEGRVEKAHKGAIISVKWNYEGAALATWGEDGQIKVWAKNGELRSQLVKSTKPIYCVVWSPDNNNILYASENKLTIIPSRPGKKPTSWKAHDGVVLCWDWSVSTNLIVSGGEDCKYRVWDSYGRQLYTSAAYDYVITSVKWSPNGEVFAVGSFEMIRLCDKSGWSYSFVKHEGGSLMKLSWDRYGNVVAGAGGNGRVVFGYIVDRHLSWGNIEVNLDENNKITVNDYVNEVSEEIDFSEKVINMSLRHHHLIACTASQAYIYNVSHISSPFVVDVKEPINSIVQGAKYVVLVDASQNIHVYDYEGKHISSPKFQGMKVESISSDVIALLDKNNPRLIRLFDVISGKALNSNIENSNDIISLQLNQTEMVNERKLCFIDSNRDMFLTMVHKPDVIKIATMVDSFQWNDNNDMLTCLADGKLITWFYPNSIYVDKDLMDKARSVKDATDLGKLPQIIHFTGSMVSIRQLDGSLACLSVPPFAKIMYEHIDNADFDRAIKLCRFVNDRPLWACLAAMSIYWRELETAEIALASIDEVDKVQFINYIKELPSEASRNSALAMYCKKINEAEQILLQAKLFYRAIKMNIKLFRWDRALDLAIKNKTHVDTVLAFRQKYLEDCRKDEDNDRFKEYMSEVQIDWETIKAKIEAEKAKEEQSG
jgi:intraflagellar transport protein 80